MKNFSVTITNNLVEKIERVAYNERWVTNQQEAESMVASQINPAWKVIAKTK